MGVEGGVCVGKDGGGVVVWGIGVRVPGETERERERESLVTCG